MEKVLIVGICGINSGNGISTCSTQASLRNIHDCFEAQNAMIEYIQDGNKDIKVDLDRIMVFKGGTADSYPAFLINDFDFVEE